MRFLCVLSLFISITGCDLSRQKKVTSELNLGLHAFQQKSIDLRTLENEFRKTEVIKVQNDPVYHKTKIYNCVDLNELLKKHFDLKSLNLSDYKMVFECIDGYKPEMPLEKLMGAKAYLAISDASAPKGEKWEEIRKDGHLMNAAPFYVVYTGISPEDGSYKWPYNLTKVHIKPLNSDLTLTLPKQTSAKPGLDLFQKHCKTCHAVNGVGGEMGPELNYPKNITEYWHRADLEAFIKNPAAYRNNVRMPTLTLSDIEIGLLVDYLQVMKNQKISE